MERELAATQVETEDAEGRAAMRGMVQQAMSLVDQLLADYGHRTTGMDMMLVAPWVAAAHEECAQNGTSFRAWVREHMRVSMPTAYKLVRVGQYLERRQRAEHPEWYEDENDEET
jgi:hypothetical protein